MRKGELSGALFCPSRGIQACRLGCSQSITPAHRRPRWGQDRQEAEVDGPSLWSIRLAGSSRTLRHLFMCLGWGGGVQ